VSPCRRHGVSKHTHPDQEHMLLNMLLLFAITFSMGTIDPGCTAQYPCAASVSGQSVCWPYHCVDHCSQNECEPCSNSCRYASDGGCDDGGPGSVYNFCFLGADCQDCGPRSFGAQSGTGGSTGLSPSSPSPSSTSSPSASPSSSPSASPSSSTSGIGDICSTMNQVLPSQCTCRATNAATGLFAECQESLPFGLGTVGVRVEIEPCEDPAYAALSYRLLGDWVYAQRVQSGGDPALIQIPGLSYAGAGLYLDVRLSGSLTDLSVHVLLSLCMNSNSCNANIMIVGSVIGAAGFPISVVEFDDLGFEGYCPADDNDIDIVIIAAAAGGAVLVLLLFVGLLCWKKTRTSAKKPFFQEPGGTAMTANAGSDLNVKV